MITDYKIQEWTNPIADEADRPLRSAYDMKRVFDSNSNQLKSALNNLIDELSEQGASNIGINLDGSESDNVQDVIQDIHTAVRENAHNIDEIGEMTNQIQSDVRDLDDDVENLLETTENVAYKEDLESYALKSELENLPIAGNIRDGSMPGSLRSSYAAIEGDGYTIGENATAFGYLTKASGEHSHAEGRNTKALGGCSHAEGYDTTASGYYSHAEGYSTTASGQDSHAEGTDTLAEGYRSHAEGRETITTIYAPNSHAEGWGTIAGSPEQHVQGRYNIEDENSKYAHVVGNGWESGDVVTRSNAHTLSWTGNAWYQGRIKVGGTGWSDATDEVALKSDLEDIGGSISDNDILAALIETDSLPAITTTAGAILTDTQGNIIIRY